MLAIRRLIWDSWNIAHIARHHVIPEEVEAVCHGDYIVRQAYQGRLMLIGPTAAGRVLAVILDSQGEGLYYPVTARPADRKERRIWREERGASPS